MKSDGRFAEEVIERAIAGGADQAEIFLRSSRGLSIEVKDRRVDSIKSSRGFGYSLRVIKGGRLGFAYSNSSEEKEAVISDAISAAEYSDEDLYLDLPGPAPYTDIPPDPEIGCILNEMPGPYTQEDAVEKVKGLEIRVFEEDPRIRKIRKASGSFTYSETAIFSSKKINASYRSTACSAQVTAIAEENGDSQVGWDFDSGAYLKDLSFEDVARRAARNAVRLLKPRKIAGFRGNVVLDSSVSVDFLGILASSVSSEAVQKGKSLFAGKLGKGVISPLLDIRDSGLIPGRVGSGPVDDEGVPSMEKAVVDRGVLNTFLYNTYTAKKDGVRSTGNAVRGSYSSMPSVGITNFVMDAAQPAQVVGEDDLFKKIGTGLYIVDAMGVHTANPISGDFTVGVAGIWIEGGEPAFPVKESVMSGNVLDLFSRVEAVGGDLRFYGNIAAPSLAIGDVDISA